MPFFAFLYLFAITEALKSHRAQSEDPDLLSWLRSWAQKATQHQMKPYIPTGPDALVALATYKNGMSGFVWRFAKSARMAGYTGRIILGVHPNFFNNSRDQEIASALGITPKIVKEAPCILPYEDNNQGGYMLRDVCSADFPHLKLESARFALAGEWLKECTECTGWTMVNDANDLYLQRPPFEGMGSPKGDELILVEEYGGSPHGIRTTHWFVNGPSKRCYDFDLGDNPMLCSGSIIGAKEQMVKFLQRYKNEFENNLKKGLTCDPKSIADQAVLNYLYYSGSLAPLNVKTSQYGQGPVATLGAVCTPTRGSGADPPDHSATDVLKLDEEGYVLFDNGAKANIVHQDKVCYKNLVTKYLNSRYSKSVEDVMSRFHE